ncbi:DinB family protein [Rossellomorea marisflavi]|uniref:DinB family protein n=1 Tax=Rossellomorea marisflavi TaxID=189381 RepID=UPI00285303B7|nr:DinB family protein [Rossellomorea marisflavi]MDR4935825.1 DinB family protein [Rossellomorea marisflavi]
MAERRYIIEAVEPFEPEVGRLVSMMEYTRYTTLREVEGLTVEQFDTKVAGCHNTIGMLLLHMASVEEAFQIMTFGDRDLNDEEWNRLEAGIDLMPIEGHEPAFYVDRLAEVRKRTLELFAGVGDEWLDRQSPFGWDHPANHYFKWFHVFEDELNHRGQIRLIVKQLKKRESN